MYKGQTFTLCINKWSSGIDAVCVAETGSESFDKFLGLLGDSVTLQGWAGYRGGLDTKSESSDLMVCIYISVALNENALLLPFSADDTTGIKSIYTVYQGHELMFHVSTMLPYSKENKQQVGVCEVACLSVSAVLKKRASLHLK